MKKYYEEHPEGREDARDRALKSWSDVEIRGKIIEAQNIGKAKKRGPLPEHGTIARFRSTREGGKCRCEPCKKAMAEYNRNWIPVGKRK